jgi:hypothetical protein
VVWDDLEQIAWHRLEHNYGQADDVPGWLRDCASDDAERAATALDAFDAAVYHQGGWICPAAPVTLPFLVDLAAGRAVHHRSIIDERIAGLQQAAALLAQWRTATPALHDFLIDRLAEPTPRSGSGPRFCWPACPRRGQPTSSPT